MDEYFILSFIIIFIIFFLVHFLCISRPYLLTVTGKKKAKKNTKTKRKPKKEKSLIEIEYLCGKFKLNKNKLEYKRVLFAISLIDSFIVTLVTLIVDLIPVYIAFKFIIGFVLLFGLIYATYEIYGRHLKKKEMKD